MYFSSRKQRHIFNYRKRNPRRMRRMAFSCTSPSDGGGSRAADVRATKCPFASPLPPIRLQPWRSPFPTHPAHGPRQHRPTCAGPRTTTPPAGAKPSAKGEIHPERVEWTFPVFLLHQNVIPGCDPGSHILDTRSGAISLRFRSAGFALG